MCVTAEDPTSLIRSAAVVRLPYDTGVGSDWSGANDSGLAGVYGQAVTDIVGGVEHYVDAYGSSLLTITGFEFGTGTDGDTLMFNVDDWAIGPLSGHPASGTGSSLHYRDLPRPGLGGV